MWERERRRSCGADNRSMERTPSASESLELARRCRRMQRERDARAHIAPL